MPDGLTQRERSALQHVANSLAQLAVGWQIVNDGEVFRDQPDTGEIEVDLTSGEARINGTTTTMGIALHAAAWMRDEYGRKPWLATLMPDVELVITYRVVRRLTNHADSFGVVVDRVAQSVTGAAGVVCRAVARDRQGAFRSRDGEMSLMVRLVTAYLTWLLPIFVRARSRPRVLRVMMIAYIAMALTAPFVHWPWWPVKIVFYVVWTGSLLALARWPARR